jgi:hypothetical protein
MSTNPRFERFLERIDPARRDALRKILAGAAVYSAPLIASFSMSNLDGVAQAQSRNQTGAAIPASSGWTLAALTAAIGAAATLVLRRRRDR